MEMQVLKCILDKSGRASTLLGTSELIEQLQTLNWNTSQERKSVRTEKHAHWEIAPGFSQVHAEVSLHTIVNSKISPTGQMFK